MKNHWTNIVAAIWLLLISFLTVIVYSPEYLNADVIINSIMSLQKLTLYYWGQNRLLNILPFVVSVIPNPAVNLFAILVLASVFHYCLLYFLSRAAVTILNVEDKNGVSLKVFLIISSGFIFLFRPSAIFEIAIWHFEYTLALLSFVLVGLRVFSNKGDAIDGWTWGVIGIVVFLVMGLNPSILIPLVFWVGAHIFYNRKFAFNDVCLLLFGLIFFIIWKFIAAKYGSMPYANFNINSFSTSTQIVLVNMLGAVNLPLFLLLSALFFGFGMIVFSPKNKLERYNSPGVSYVKNAAALFSIFWFLLFSASRWVEVNKYAWRYFIYIFFALIFIFAIYAAAYISKYNSKRIARMIFLIPVTVVLYLSSNLSWKNFDSYKIFQRVNSLTKSDGNLYAGDYWLVWPSVLRDMINGYESYGVTLRGEANEGMVRKYVFNKIESNGYVTFYCLDDRVSNCKMQINKIAGPLLEIDSRKINENLHTLTFKNYLDK